MLPYLFLKPCLIPHGCLFHCLRYLPVRFPAKCRTDLRAVQFQEIRLVRPSLIQIFPRCLLSPGVTEQVCQLTGGDTVLISRSNVIGTGTRRIFILCLRDYQIRTKRFQHMLIRSCGMWIPYRYFFLLRLPARSDPVRAKSPPPITLPLSPWTPPHRLLLRRIFHSCGSPVRNRTCCWNRIVPIQLIDFLIAPLPLVVFIDFIRCHIQERFYTFCLAHRF